MTVQALLASTRARTQTAHYFDFLPIRTTQDVFLVHADDESLAACPPIFGSGFCALARLSEKAADASGWQASMAPTPAVVLPFALLRPPIFSAPRFLRALSTLPHLAPPPTTPFKDKECVPRAPFSASLTQLPSRSACR